MGEIETFKKIFIQTVVKQGESNGIRNKIIELSKDNGVEFFVSNLKSDDPCIRNESALALREIKADEAVPFLLKAISKEANYNRNGTMVYVLQFLKCTKYLKEIFEILFYQGFEARLMASQVLSSQKFELTKEEIKWIRSTWDAVLQKKEATPNLSDDMKEFIQEKIDDVVKNK